MFPVIVLKPPVITLVTLHWTEHNLLMTLAEPHIFLDLVGQWRGVYQTSVPYVNLGTATVMYNCFVPKIETPLVQLPLFPLWTFRLEGVYWI